MTDVSPCPAEADLLNWLCARTPEPKQQAALTLHLDGCRKCQSVLDKHTQIPAAVEGRLKSWRLTKDSRPREAFLRSHPTDGPRCETPSATSEVVVPIDVQAMMGEHGQLLGGKYVKREGIGAGGMGEVFRAWDVTLNRDVAIKFIRSDKADDARTRARFLVEAKCLAGVDDPNVVGLYEVNDSNETPFLVMQYLRGQSLDQRLAEAKQLPLPEALDVARQAALGLSAIHDGGLVHRDVKPANLFVERPSGRVKVLDFGLARSRQSDAGFTQAGGVVGSPWYMAPEQARGKQPDARADLWGLGVVLYEALTGTRPFPGEDPAEVVAAVIRDPVPSLGLLRPELPAALSALVDQMLAKDPAGRPASAREVARRLEEIARGRPSIADTAVIAVAAPVAAVVQPGPIVAVAEPARDVRPARKGPRWRLLAAASLLVVLSLVGYLYGGTVIRFARNQGQVVVEVDDPDLEVTVKKNGAVISDDKGKQTITIAAGEQELDVTVKNDKGEVRFSTRKFTLRRGGKEVVRVRWGAMPSVEPEGGLDLLAPASIPQEEQREWHPKELVAVLGKQQEGKKQCSVFSVAFSRDGSHLLAGASDASSRWWDLRGGKTDRLIETPNSGCFAALAGDDQLVLEAGWDFPPRFWDLRKNEQVGVINRSDNVILCCPVFTPDRKEVLVAHRDVSDGASSVIRWDVGKLRQVKAYRHDRYVHCVALAPDGKRFVTSCRDGKIRLWDVEKDKELSSFPLPRGRIPWGLAWSPDGKRLLSGDLAAMPKGDEKDSVVRVWSLEGNEARLEKTYDADLGDTPQAMAWSPDGKSIAYADYPPSGNVVVRDVASGRKRAEWRFLKNPVYSLAFAPDSRHLALGTKYGAVYVLRLSAK